MPIIFIAWIWYFNTFHGNLWNMRKFNRYLDYLKNLTDNLEIHLKNFKSWLLENFFYELFSLFLGTTKFIVKFMITEVSWITCETIIFWSNYSIGRYSDEVVRLRNPNIGLMDEDILYHLALGSRSHNLVEMFSDVKVLSQRYNNFGEKFWYILIFSIVI